MNDLTPEQRRYVAAKRAAETRRKKREDAIALREAVLDAIEKCVKSGSIQR